MRAAYCTKYGAPEVLEVREVPKPVPKKNEILIKVHASTVTTGDARIRGFRTPILFWVPMRLIMGITKPRKPILGVELAGEVVEVGEEVKRFSVGDSVFAMTGMRFGGHAEFITLKDSATVVPMPKNFTYEEAGSVLFGSTSALYFLRKGKIQANQHVLIYGASGSVGCAAVQLAKYFGAKVTGVCSEDNADLVKRLGADYTLDYSKKDFHLQENQYDIIFDAVGKITKNFAKSALTKNGRFVSVEGQGVAIEKVEDIEFLKKVIEEGKLLPVIEKIYSLEEIQEAHRHVDSERKKGNVVVKLSAISE